MKFFFLEFYINVFGLRGRKGGETVGQVHAMEKGPETEAEQEARAGADSVGSQTGADSVGSRTGTDSVGSRTRADSVGSRIGEWTL